MYTYIYREREIYDYICIYIHTYTYLHVYINIYTHIYVYTHIYRYIYMYICRRLQMWHRHCNILPHTATRHNTPQHTPFSRSGILCNKKWNRLIVYNVYVCRLHINIYIYIHICTYQQDGMPTKKRKDILLCTIKKPPRWLAKTRTHTHTHTHTRTHTYIHTRIHTHA